MIKIDKGIPPPSKHKREADKYPFGEMEIGDSFLTEERPQIISSVARQFAKRCQPDWKFTCRKTEGGTRCWRIK